MFVSVQFPAGKLDNSTLPVGDEQLGFVTVPTVGIEGISSIVTEIAVRKLSHPKLFVSLT